MQEHSMYKSHNIMKSGTIFLIFLLLGLLIGTAITNVKVAADTADEEQKVDKLAQELKDVSNSIQYDSKTGLATGLDVNALTAKYGTEDINKLNKTNEILQYQYIHNLQISSQQLQSLQSKAFWPCMKNQLLDMVGFQVYQALLRGGIKGLIERKAWKAAAKIIVRYLGDGVGVGILAAQLSWYAAKCIS
ncbi:hypothetical protein [Ligilactobacillus acidipiscis]|uniref:hypothetical protein n=1 Tax=Ligilactobacillus acidipiscis TaxID=89059 RepID=UPI0023F7798D|nr:hypothetical protein [Ligilactobacillus acidipiscis]WEV58182.1 hypothetical protein OZX66_12220 [Ligilactobacillus acidipiscis]